jgi:hypothetical protein
MERLTAIRTNFDPFPPRLGLRANSFAVLRCTIYRCPYCRWIFKITWGPSNTLLGPGDRICWHCKDPLSDESLEWPEMSNDDRMKFFLPISVAGLSGCFLVVLGMYLITLLSFHETVNPGDAIFFAAFLLPVACWCLFRSVQILRSVRRYNRRKSSAFA